MTQSSQDNARRRPVRADGSDPCRTDGPRRIRLRPRRTRRRHLDDAQDLRTPSGRTLPY
ncbi:hypothetical protein [Sphaerisporangium sp. TRM90804]|uniref:hypothetical protein n=1 Tax=Sphaerisporangium sp. TRM90804 TaxID=3031113 RepID=UPI00244CD3D7|nr:hypothetical protein [Sphaerisporangium sp. TRM90804]MDH2428919.1 hypothetical protein [Sphaerisporangium sp. TRM90804]